MLLKDSLIMQKVIAKMEKGYSPVILVVGKPNSGKTMLSAKIAEIIEPIFHNREWDHIKYTIFDMNEFSYKFLSSKRCSFVIAEAGFDLAFDEWFNKTNKFFDKIITTQRVMGNLYLLNIPVGKDLARRHRRKVDYILQVKGHGRFKAIINRVKTEVMVGSEFKPFSLEEYYGIRLPKCHEPLTALDKSNKEKIRETLVTDYQEDCKKREEKIFDKKRTYAKITCPNGHTYKPSTARPVKCAKCNIRFKWD